MSKPQATSLDHREVELFRGRERELELARGLWSVPLPADQRRVLLFTGIGGIGKSALGRRIIREIGQSLASDGWLETPRPAFAAIDFAEAASEDVVRALLQLRLQLALTWRDARFPLFDFAFARIHEARYPGSDVRRQYAALNPDGAVLRRLAPALPDAVLDSNRLQDAADGINELLAETPLIGTVYKYLNHVVAKGLDALDRRTEPLLREIAGTDAVLLDQRLPECLGLDLVNAIRTAEQRRPVTIVIDTLEAIHRRAPQQSGIEAFQNDAWLHELVWQAKGVGFILLGRDDIEWPSFEHSPVRDWRAVVDAYRLGELSDPEVASILAAFPVADPDVPAAIRQGAAGLPFYLGLQLDIFRDLSAEGITPTPEHFGRAPKAVPARFANHLGQRLASAFTTLAHARRFDEPLVAHLKTRPGTLIGPVGLPEITRYSLIEGDPDRTISGGSTKRFSPTGTLAASRPTSAVSTRATRRRCARRRTTSGCWARPSRRTVVRALPRPPPLAISASCSGCWAGWTTPAGPKSARSASRKRPTGRSITRSP